MLTYFDALSHFCKIRDFTYTIHDFYSFWTNEWQNNLLWLFQFSIVPSFITTKFRRYISTVSQNGLKRNVGFTAKDYRRVKGDPLGVQNNHESKSPTVGRSNKIFPSSFGIVLQPIFVAFKKGYSENENWYFSQKITSCFLVTSKKCPWADVPKMGQKPNFSLKWQFF